MSRLVQMNEELKAINQSHFTVSVSSQVFDYSLSKYVSTWQRVLFLRIAFICEFAQAAENYFKVDFQCNKLHSDERQPMMPHHSQRVIKAVRLHPSCTHSRTMETIVHCSRLQCSEKKAAECRQSLTFTGEEEEEEEEGGGGDTMHHTSSKKFCSREEKSQPAV